ncbi:MAG TPA: UDP-3-O-(3-hydroxymyristoyl)glucosamine N-acyltransferase [Myxococcaceae bacterium]|nr:UDP-3-O-(3-hydroxymyristoyl)glucosamine N-acyltransferase [Myxococcaceae bacterium]
MRVLSELASAVGGQVIGNPSLTICGVNVLADAGPGELSFYGSTRYRAELETTRASAVLINGDTPMRQGVTWVRVSSPHLAFAKISAMFHPRPRFAAGIRPGAHVHAEATVHPEAAVMAGATVEKGATVGARAVLFPGVFVGEDASVGEDTLLYPNAVIRERCVVGARVIVHACAVIGADGFGFALDLDAGEHFKIPQAGIVRVEDDVEIGACTTIDRATLGETLVGRGTKIDNLVQIAHNVRIGPMSIICGQVGLSGSTEIGSGVVLAGQVGVAGHIRVGDLARVGPQAGVAHDVPDGATVSGSPAFDHRDWLKASVVYPQLAEMVKEVRRLRRRVEELEAEKSDPTLKRQGGQK